MHISYAATIDLASGGILGGGLINGIYPGALGAGIAIAVSALVQVRAVAWSIVPLLVAAATSMLS